MMRYLVLLLIIACGYDAFYLFSDYRVKGVFNIVDVGNLFLLIYLLFAFLNDRLTGAFRGAGIFVLLYLFMVTVHVAIASFFYGQSVLDGIIAARHQAYYLMFFVFYAALDSEERINQFFRLLTYVAVALVLLSVLNYVGISVLHHERWSEGHGERSGIARAFIPGMHLLSILFVWYLAKYLSENKVFSRNGLWAGFFILGMFFRQTRARLIAALFTMLAMMLGERKIKMLAAAILVGTIGTAAISAIMEENIVINLLTSAFTDVAEGEGTWRGRQITLENSMEAFLQHPVIGNGSLVIRNPVEINADIRSLAYQADLGYVHWLKNFGSIGLLWLIFLNVWVYAAYKYNRRIDNGDWQSLFAFYAIFQIMVSMFTLNYLVKVQGIIVFSLALAVLVRRRHVNIERSRSRHAGE